MKTKRNFFPIGDKAFVSFEDVPKVMRKGHEIFFDEIYSFFNSEEATEAMIKLWEMYDEEQILRNEGGDK